MGDSIDSVIGDLPVYGGFATGPGLGRGPFRAEFAYMTDFEG